MNLSRTNGTVGYRDIASGISASCRLDITVDDLRAAITMVADEHNVTLSDVEKGWALDIALSNIDARRCLAYRHSSLFRTLRQLT